MSATDKLFGGSIPEIYERLLVPLLFEPYAKDLAERVVKIGPSQILEIAAGTGISDPGARNPLASERAYCGHRSQ